MLWAFLQPAIGQNTKDLEVRREKLLNEIKTITAELQKTRSSKTATLEQLNLLQNQIARREELVDNIQGQVSETSSRIAETETVIQSMQDDLTKMQNEYNNMLRKAYRIQLGSSDWMYLMSSTNLNQAFGRWQYLKQIKKFRKNQMQQIEETQASLQEKINQLSGQKKQKENLLREQEEQKTVLQQEAKEKDSVLANLTKNEKKLSGEISKKQVAQKKLAKEIERIIREEIARREREAKRRAEEERKKALAEEAARKKKEKEEEAKKTASPSKKNTTKPKEPKEDAPAPKVVEKEKKSVLITETPQEKELSDNFRSNRGRLPWPVAKGAITRQFGVQPHPTLRNVTTQSNGIDIRTDHGGTARAVFKGVVLAKTFIAGMNQIVIIQHGSYYSVYSNLSSVNVKVGQKVDTKTALGVIGNSIDTNEPELHFEIWYNQEKQNPASWISR